MILEKKIDIEKIIKKMKNYSGAEIKAVCAEAGYFAIRKNRDKIKENDILEAIDKKNAREEVEGTDYLNQFG